MLKNQIFQIKLHKMTKKQFNNPKTNQKYFKNYLIVKGKAKFKKFQFNNKTF